jgi:hypothetical protein
MKPCSKCSVENGELQGTCARGVATNPPPAWPSRSPDSVLHIGTNAHVQQLVKASRSKERGVDEVGPVAGPNDEQVLQDEDTQPSSGGKVSSIFQQSVRSQEHPRQQENTTAMLSSSSIRQSEPNLLVTGRVTGQSYLLKITALCPSAHLALVLTFIYNNRSVSASNSSLGRFAAAQHILHALVTRHIWCRRGFKDSLQYTAFADHERVLRAFYLFSTGQQPRARASPGRPVLRRSRPASG